MGANTITKQIVVANTTTYTFGVNRRRPYFYVKNIGTNPLEILLGTDAVAGTDGLVLAAGQSWEPWKAPAGQVRLYAPSGDTTAALVTDTF